MNNKPTWEALSKAKPYGFSALALNCASGIDKFDYKISGDLRLRFTSDGWYLNGAKVKPRLAQVIFEELIEDNFESDLEEVNDLQEQIEKVTSKYY